MSQASSSSKSQTSDRQAVAVLGGFALPSWLISIFVHAGLLLILASLTWTVARQMPDQQFKVGIMVKKDTPEGQVFESQDSSYTAREQATPETAKFLPETEPAAVAQSLPKLPEVDLSTIGLSGSMLSGAGEILAVPDTGAAAGAMVNTQFFGAQVWGNKFAYVIDRSGSMSQRDRLGAAKRELLGSLAKLPPETQFQVIFYNMQPKIMPVGGSTRRMLYATDGNKTLAARFMDQIVADGGTDHLPALKQAIGLEPDVIFFLTDADDLRARDVKEATESNKDRCRIHTIEFGIGAEVDRENMLRELALQNGGTYRYIDAAQLDRRGGEFGR